MELAIVGVAKGLVELYVVHKLFVPVPDEFPYEIGYIDVGGGGFFLLLFLVIIGDGVNVGDEAGCRPSVDLEAQYAAEIGPSVGVEAHNGVDFGPHVELEAQNIEVEVQGVAEVGVRSDRVGQGAHDNVDIMGDSNDEDDPDYEEDSNLYFSDSEDDFCGDDGLFDVEFTLGELQQEIKDNKQAKAREVMKKKGKETAGVRVNSGLSDDKGINNDELEELQSEDGDDEDGSNVSHKRKFSIHKKLKDMSQYRWEVAMLYATREEVKDIVTTYVVHSGKNIKLSVVDNHRVRVAKCGCGWFTYAVKMLSENSWQLRSVGSQHTCGSDFNIRVMKSKWLAKVFKNKVEENPKIKLGTIQSMTLAKWNVRISRAKAFREKQIALMDINGTFREQYRRLYDYGNELLRTNHGSTVKIQVQQPAATQSESGSTSIAPNPLFQRIYICLKACRDSFMV